MNFRVALQYEYTALGLDNCLERLGHHESDELAVQITAYVDNIVDVQELMEEAEIDLGLFEKEPVDEVETEREDEVEEVVE